MSQVAVRALPSSMHRATALLIPALLASCVTVLETRTSAPPAPAVASLPSEAWAVQDASGDELGLVVRFEEIAPDLEGPPRTFLSVRNLHGQELGLVDDKGRAWRYRPHAAEPDWVGTAGSTEGVALILLGNPAPDSGTARRIRLVPVELDDLKIRLCLNPAESAARQGT